MMQAQISSLPAGAESCENERSSRAFLKMVGRGMSPMAKLDCDRTAQKPCRDSALNGPSTCAIRSLDYHQLKRAASHCDGDDASCGGASSQLLRRELRMR